MSIDDNHQNLSLIQQALEGHFDIISSTGDESIEELVIDCEPHIILLDIMLLNKSGYDVCRSLRDKGLAKNIIIIFISSLNSLQDKLKAYEAGGDDYICKPVDLAELEYKLESHEKRIKQHRLLETKVEEVSQAAYASMLQSSELAMLISFVKQSMTINDFDQLFGAVQSSLGHFQLNCVMEIRIGRQALQFPKEQISQLELEILDLGKRAKRVVSFGRNVLFSSTTCSLLVKNMPQDEEDQGRVRDHLAMLLELINSRAQSIFKEISQASAHQQTINDKIDGLQQHIEQVFKQMSAQLEQTQLEGRMQKQVKQVVDNGLKQCKSYLKMTAQTAEKPKSN